MKNKFAHTSIIAAAILTIVTLFVTNCKKPTDGVNLILNTNLIRSAVGVSFIDAKTGEPIGYSDGTKLTMSINDDANKGAIIDVMGTTDFKVSSGFASLAIDPDFTPTPTKPIKFVIKASAPGYLTTSLPVTITKEGGFDFTISMIKMDAPPSGVAATDTTITTNGSGATTDPITINSGVVSTTGTEAVITIPAGTILKDENGNPLSGDLKTNFVYFSDGTDASLNSFPGGLSASTDQGDKFFSTAGFVSLEISNQAGTTHVKTFTPSIQVQVDINPNTKRPDGSGGLVSVSNGDSIPIWSYDVVTGEWLSESQKAVTNVSGKQIIVIDVNHLSYWNLDWFYAGSCGIGASIKVASNLSATGTYNSNYFYYELRRAADNSFLKSGNQDFTNGNSFTLLNAPNIAANLKIYEGGSWYACSANLKEIGSLMNINLCSGNYSVNVTGTAPQVISLKVSAKCDNRPNFIIRPTIPIYFKEVGSTCNNWWQYAGFMINGEISSNAVKLNKTYVFGISFDGKWYETPQYKVDQTSYVFDYTFTALTCNKFK